MPKILPRIRSGNLPARISRYEIVDPDEHGVLCVPGLPVDPVERRLAIRHFISEAERKIALMPPVDPVMRHHFSKGIYAREMFIPAGTVLTGKIHRHEHLNIISCGDISVLTEEGPRRIVAPYTVVSAPGTKRLGYAHADTVWTTIHATHETDLELLEEEFITQEYEPILVERFTEDAICLGAQ